MYMWKCDQSWWYNRMLMWILYAGTYSDEGAAECKPCPIGFNQSESGQSSCKPCPPGTYATLALITIIVRVYRFYSYACTLFTAKLVRSFAHHVKRAHFPVGLEQQSPVLSVLLALMLTRSTWLSARSVQKEASLKPVAPSYVIPASQVGPKLCASHHSHRHTDILHSSFVLKKTTHTLLTWIACVLDDFWLV